MKIGFYDSGLGGIKTLKDIIDMGLKEEIYFLADVKNRPYGTKDVEKIRQIARKNVKILVELGCQIIVIACNTATSAAIEYLRKDFSSIEIIGTEPAVKLATKEKASKTILVLATTITTKGEKLKNLINTLGIKERTELLAVDNLVSLIEDENFSDNQEEANDFLREILAKYDLDKLSHIILGCTHFSLVKKNLENILKEKNKNIKVLDGNKEIGNNLFSKITKKEDKEKTNNTLCLKIIMTSEDKAFKKRTKEILNDIDYEYLS